MKKLLGIAILLLSIAAFSYIIKSEDVLNIEIYTSTGKILTRNIPVDIEGYAPIPYVGRKKVEGMSLDSVQQMVENAVKSFLPSAIVVVSLVKPRSEYVFFQGMINGAIDISSIIPENRRLLYLMGILASKYRLYVNNEYLENVRIIRNSETFTTDIKKFYQTGDNKYNPILKANDIVYIPVPGKVAVIGYVGRPGIYSVPQNGSIMQILSMAGAKLDDNFVKSINIYRGNSIIKINYPDQKNKLLSPVEDGDIIEVVPYSQINVYIIGEVSLRLTLSEKDSPTLRKIIANANIPFINDIKRKIVLIRNNSEKAFVVSNPAALPEIPIEDGDIIGVYLLKPVMVYVNSDNAAVQGGLVKFDYFETPTLKTLLYKLNIDLNNTGIFISNASKTIYIPSEDILNGSTDVLLSNYDYIYVTSSPYGKVNLIGFNESSIGLLKPQESLKSILERVSPAVPYPEIDSFVVNKNNKVITVNVNDINGQKNLLLSNGDTVSIKLKKEKYVYVVGDVSAILQFTPDEKISKDTIVAKLGIERNRIEKIEGTIADKGVVKIKLKKPVRIYIGGDSVQNSFITFDWDEPHVLKDAILKAGGIVLQNTGSISLREYRFRIIIVRNGKEIFSKTVNYNELYTLNEELEDGDAIYVYSNQIRVRVIGVANQGIYYLPDGSKFNDLFAMLGPVDKEVDTLLLVRNGEKKEYSILYDNVPDFLLKNNDTIILIGNNKHIVYILGEVDNPGYVYTYGKPLNILKALSIVGGLNNWESKRTLYVIKNNGKKEIYNLNYEDLKNVVLNDGDIVYVNPSHFNRVYVLGAVNNPTVVYIDTKSTLMDVIVRAGGFSKEADLSRVYIFRGGLNGNIEVYDMRWVTDGRAGKNPHIQPGDIVYVPNNPYVTINEIISMIQSTLTFVNSSIDLYRNINNVIQGK